MGAPEHTARDVQALELPLGEPLPVLADRRVEPQRELLHETPCARRLARVSDLVVVRIGSGERHVLAHRSRKQEVVLRHIRERPRRHLGRGARRALLKLVHEAVGVIGAQRQLEQRGLARPGRPLNHHEGSLGHKRIRAAQAQGLIAGGLLARVLPQRCAMAARIARRGFRRVS